jgi:hypothetical protein
MTARNIEYLAWPSRLGEQRITNDEGKNGWTDGISNIEQGMQNLEAV